MQVHIAKDMVVSVFLPQHTLTKTILLHIFAISCYIV